MVDCSGHHHRRRHLHLGCGGRLVATRVHRLKVKWRHTEENLPFEVVVSIGGRPHQLTAWCSGGKPLSTSSFNQKASIRLINGIMINSQTKSQVIPKAYFRLHSIELLGFPSLHNNFPPTTTPCHGGAKKTISNRIINIIMNINPVSIVSSSCYFFYTFHRGNAPHRGCKRKYILLRGGSLNLITFQQAHM